MQKNKRIGLQHEATLDVLLRHLMSDLETVNLGCRYMLLETLAHAVHHSMLRTFKLHGINRKLCFYGLAGDQKWFQQVLQLLAAQVPFATCPAQALHVQPRTESPALERQWRSAGKQDQI